MSRSLNPRAMDFYRKGYEGCSCTVVEHRVQIPARKTKAGQWIPGKSFTRDLLGFADILVMYPAFGLAAVQVTSGSNHAARRTKILETPEAALWARCGGIVHLLSFTKARYRTKSGAWSKAKRYKPRLELLTDQLLEIYREIYEDDYRRTAAAAGHVLIDGTPTFRDDAGKALGKGFA